MLPSPYERSQNESMFEASVLYYMDYSDVSIFIILNLLMIPSLQRLERMEKENSSLKERLAQVLGLVHENICI
jgi:hypothetical protein